MALWDAGRQYYLCVDVELRESEMKASSHTELAARFFFFWVVVDLVWVGVDLLLLFFDFLTV